MTRLCERDGQRVWPSPAAASACRCATARAWRASVCLRRSAWRMPALPALPQLARQTRRPLLRHRLQSPMPHQIPGKSQANPAG